MIRQNHNPKPSELAFVPFVSVDDMMRNIRTIGVEKAIRGIADYIEQDFLRWESFDKKPRIPAHAPQGVIELMPTSDGETFGFKYVNGHPQNVREGLQTVTGFGVLWAMLLLGESYSHWIWAAMGLMLIGLFLVQPRPRAALVPASQFGDTGS